MAKVAVVTGGGSGIGAAAATALARDGWKVVIAGRRRPPLEGLASAHPDLTLDPVAMDVTDEDGRAYNIACGQIDPGNTATDMTAATATGSLQADGSVRPEPHMDADDLARAVVYMASLPLDSNVATMTVLPTKMPYVGRG